MPHGDGDEALPSLAIEVPLYCSAYQSKSTTIQVAGTGGDPLLTFPLATVAGSTLLSAQQIPVAVHTPLNASSALIWKVQADEPAVLSLQEFSFSSDQREEVCVQFSAPLLPHISSVEAANEVQLAAITADGVLHVVNLSSQRQQPLQWQLALPGALRAVPLAAAFHRLGAPTALLHVSGSICIGTDQGHVLCLPAANPDAEAAVELKTPAAGLGAMLGSFFGKAPVQPVQQLAELRFLSHCFLCSFHEGAVLRVWDIQTRRMLHSTELLPAAEASAHRAALVRVAVEPLDASTFMLLVYFEATDPASASPCYFCTYEVFLEDRDGAYKVQVERGPTLTGAMRRLQDMAVQHVGAKSIGAWLLYDDDAGQRVLHCVPVVFSDGAVELAAEADLLENQLAKYCNPQSELRVQEEVWSVIEAAAAAEIPGVAKGEAAADVFLDILLAPGRLSRPALHAALCELGCSVAAGDVLQAEVMRLRALLPGWLPGTANGGIATWCALLRAYSAAFHRVHRPLALLRMTHREGQALVLVRAGGMLSALRSARPPEVALRSLLPAAWAQLTPVGQAAAKALLQAAGLVVDALGGPLITRLMWGCMRQGATPQSVLAPAAMRVIAAGGRQAGAAAGDDGRQWRAEWRARCRRLPLAVSELCTCRPGEFATALQALLELLGQHYYPRPQHKRSPLPALTQQVMSTALGTAAQVSGAQLECVLQLQLLASYVTWSQTMGLWDLGDEDSRQLTDKVLPAAASMLKVATVAYWSAVTPIAQPEDGSAGDAAAMVVALHLGDDGDGPDTSAPKRARLTRTRDHYAAELLLAAFLPHGGHAVRDMLDLQSVAAAFARWLLCIRSVTELDPNGVEVAAVSRFNASMMHALALAPALFRGRHAAALAGLLRLLGDGEDARLQFFTACSKVVLLREATSEADRRQLEEASVSLFFCVAAIFGHREFFRPQLSAVRAAIEQLHFDTVQQALPDEGPDAAELQYYETLTGMYERLGCVSAASRFALAAAKHVALALPGEEQAEQRVHREGRLWVNVFAFCLEGGEYEAAYAALLGNQVAELQVDCVHRLVNELSSRGEVELLCRLPFAHTLLVLRHGRPVWAPLLEEAVAALRRRAANLDLTARPQPYKVLYDFHATRSNYQAAAAAQLAYARRLAAERPGDKAATEEAQRALGAALQALSLVEPEQAWLEDPAPRRSAASSSALGGPFSVNAGGSAAQGEQQGVESPPGILTLEDLGREYATARAHAAVAGAMSGGEATSSAPDDVFHQLLALGLHEEAFKLADDIYAGTKQDRAREMVVAALAATCVDLQARGGRVSVLYTAEDVRTAMEDGDLGSEDDDEGDGSVGASGGPAGCGNASPGPKLSSHGDAAALAASAAWQRLRKHLERCEAERCNGFSLRVVAVDAVLTSERRFCPPPWLLAPFLVPPPSPGTLLPQQRADVAGLLRAFMRHGRLEDAAAVAERHLSAVVHCAPSVALARTAAVCLPHGLLQELAARLQAQGGELASAGHKVGELLKAERVAAAQQNDRIEQIYA